MNVLVVAAHPDDEVLGCGATIARLTAGGHRVSVAILGEGVSSRYDRRDEADPSSIDRLRDASRRATDLLGVAALTFHALPDNRFDTVPLLDVVKLVEKQIETVEPEVVYTHHGGDLNVDHQVTARATLTATRPAGMNRVRELYAYPAASSTEWSFQKLAPAFSPNTFVDIGGHLERKLQAMACYDSETRPFPHPRSPEALRALARWWGSVAGLEAAEAFELVRAIR